MAEVEINDVAKFGAVADVPPYMLPPEIWNLALNIRAKDLGLEKLGGWAPVFGTPTVAPHFVMPISTTVQNFWIYAGLTKVYVFDGTSHSNITRQNVGVDVNYSVANGRDWNGTVVGGVPILNNGSDVPQFWSTIAGGTRLANLTNWPSTLRAKIMRAHGPFLLAAGLTDSGTSFPHRVRWSHPADPGTVPSSWDINDPTKDTGELDLSDVQSGTIQEVLQLGNYSYIYKETSTWRARYVGGRVIFDFGEGPWSVAMGALSSRCVTMTGDGLKHVVATQDDIVWHNGNQIRSILDNRQRKRLSGAISTEHYENSFLFTNPLYNECWFCYPTQGQEFPDAALIMNYSDQDNWVVTEADGITFRHAAIGLIEDPSEETWEDNPTELWEEGDDPWSTLERRRVVLAGTAATKFYNLDRTGTRDSVAFNSILQRVGLSVLGRKRTGEWIVDHQVRKMLRRLWPKIQGAPVSVRVGASEVVNGAVGWSAPVSYNPQTDVVADIMPTEGRAVGVEFSGTEFWRIDGYKADIVKLGNF